LLPFAVYKTAVYWAIQTYVKHFVYSNNYYYIILRFQYRRFSITVLPIWGQIHFYNYELKLSKSVMYTILI